MVAALRPRSPRGSARVFLFLSFLFLGKFVTFGIYGILMTPFMEIMES